MADWRDRSFSAEYEQKLSEQKDQKEALAREKANADGKNTLYKQSREDIKNGLNKNILEFYNEISADSGTVFTPRNKFKISWTAFDANRKENPMFLDTLNAFNLHVDSVELPNLEIKSGETIDDGRGQYYTQSDSILVPSSNELTINYKDAEISAAEAIRILIYINSTPFFLPVLCNLKIDYFSDLDGTTITAYYGAVGCRPMSIDTIKAEHDGREINIRKVKFGFHCIDFDKSMG